MSIESIDRIQCDAASAESRHRGAGWSSSWALTEDPLNQAPEGMQRLWSEVQEHNLAGRFESASARLAELIALASRLSRCDWRDELTIRLRCAQVALDVESGGSAPMEELRSILMAARTLTTELTCAYQLAHALEVARSWKKGVYYGELALRAATRLDKPEWQAVVHNLLGNLLAGDSRFAPAEEHYRAALAAPLDSPLWRAQVEDNLSYVLAATGSLEESRNHIARALWTLRRHDGSARLSAELDVALIQCKSGRGQQALGHAFRATKMARAIGSPDDLANALLLLAECAKHSGDRFLAKRASAELAELRGCPEMADALLGIDLLNTVNLRG